MKISQVRRQSGLELAQAEQGTNALEHQYIIARDEVTCRDLQWALREVMLLRVASAKKLLLHQSHCIFEQGERTGFLLVWLSKEQLVTTGIANVKDANWQLVSDPGDINDCFASFTETSTLPGQDTLDLSSKLMESIRLPTLTEEARRRIDAPLTLKEIQQAIGSMQAGKTAGDDGPPAEFYKAHMEALGSRLLEVLSASFEASALHLQCLWPLLS